MSDPDSTELDDGQPSQKVSPGDSLSIAAARERTFDRLSRALVALRMHPYAWPTLYLGVFVAHAVMLVLVGRSQWYFFDEWRLIVERVVDPGDVSLFERLFRPDGEHVIAVPLALFIVLANIGELDSYWPFVIANVIVRLATLWLADDIVRRLGGRRAARLMVLVVIAFFGEGFESLFGQSLIFAGLTLVFGLLALREAIRDDVTTIRAVSVSTACLIAAVFSTSYAFPVVLAVAVVFALTSRFVASVVALCVPPLAFLIVRTLAGGSYSEQQAISPRFAGLYVDYVQAGLTSVGEAVTGLIGLGLAAYVAVVGLSVLLAARRSAIVLTAATTVLVVAFFGQASLSRSALGAAQASASRYLFFCAVFVLVTLGASWGMRRAVLRVAAVIGLVFIVSLANNLGRLTYGYNFYIPNMELSRERLSVGFVVEETASSFVPDPDWAPDLRLDRLDAVVAWSGATGLAAQGQSCVTHRLDALERSGVDVDSLSSIERTAMVLLLNEHALGYGVPGATLGDLVLFGAAGMTGSTVLDQFTDVYGDVVDQLGWIELVPETKRCV